VIEKQAIACGTVTLKIARAGIIMN
jgi:hypothetical protein